MVAPIGSSVSEDSAMTQLSPQAIYDNLERLDIGDVARSASYRRQAFEALTDPSVSPTWQEAICDRLNQANRRLGQLVVDAEESY